MTGGGPFPGDQSSGGALPSLKAVFWLAVGMMVAAALQGTTLDGIPPAWGQPDLLLTLALVAGLLSEGTTGGIAGFAAALFTSALVGQTVGSFLVSRTLAGFIGGASTRYLYRGHIFVVVPGVLLLSLLCEAVYLLSAPRIGLSHGFRPVLMSAVDNAVISAPIVLLLRRCGWVRR